MANKTQAADGVQCIVCEKVYAKDERGKYNELEYFDDACICNECMAKERGEWPRPQHK